MRSPAETVLGMLRTLMEIKDAGKDLIVEAVFEQELIVNLEGVRIFLQPAPNVSTCRGYWESKEVEQLLLCDGVIVFYDYAQEPGEVANCSRNNWKPDYRRLARIKHLEKVSGRDSCFQEIRTLLNKNSLRRLLSGCTVRETVS